MSGGRLVDVVVIPGALEDEAIQRRDGRGQARPESRQFDLLRRPGPIRDDSPDVVDERNRLGIVEKRPPVTGPGDYLDAENVSVVKRRGAPIGVNDVSTSTANTSQPPAMTHET